MIFFQIVYGHMERHADICKSLVYKYRERQRNMLRQNKRRSVLNKARALWIKRLKHTLVIFDGKGNSSLWNTKDENSYRRSRPVFDDFIICGLEVQLLLIFVIIMTQKKNTFVGLQIAWCLSTVMAIVRKTWKYAESNDAAILIQFSLAIWLASKPMQNMEYDIARFIVKSDN